MQREYNIFFRVTRFIYRTPLKNGKPINVTLDLVIENVETFDDIKQELELTMVLR